MALNKCIFIGRLVRDVEFKTVGDNVPVANFTIAVDKRYKGKDQKQPTADFISVAAWRKSAEFAEKYFSKGKQVSVCGSLETYTWEKEDGTKGYGFRINAEELGFADSAKNENGGNNAASGNAGGGFDDGFPAEEGFMNPDGFDDDLPF